MKNNMKIVKDNENEVKEAAVQEIDPRDLIKITPRFDQLTNKGVEMFKNMGDIENAKLWATDFGMDVGYDSTHIPGLMVLLQAIADKIESGDGINNPIDFISFLQDHLFTLTMAFEDASKVYIQTLKSGDFIVDRLIQLPSRDGLGSEEKSLKAAA